MTTQELIKAGRLMEARAQVVADIKAAPADTKVRTLLFQILAFYGEWDKAVHHLDLLVLPQAKGETGVQLYRYLIAAERHRSAVFRGECLPDFMTPEPPFLSDCFALREALSAGNVDAASELLAAIDTMMPEISGTIQDEPFTGFYDTDASLFPFLELFIHDRYLWIPFASLRELSIPQPTTLMDLLWTPARIVTTDGLTSNCFLPVLYPESASHENDLVRMGKMTEWAELGNGFYRGYGEHVYQVGDAEKSLLELGEITFTITSSGTEL